MQILRLLPRFRAIERQLRILEEREAWTSLEIQTFQLQRINDLWAHARRCVPYYIRLAGRLGLPDRFGSLDEYTHLMPLLSKEAVRDYPDDFLSRQAESGRWHRSGGSTGVPTAVYWSHTAHREMLRCKYRCEQAYGLDVLDRKVFFWGHSGSFSPGLRGVKERCVRPVQDLLRNRLRVSAYDLDANQLKQHWERIVRFQPKSIYGYSSAVELLAEAAELHSIDVPSLELAVLTAEPADRGMLERVSSRLNTRAVVEYGAVECGLMAYLMPDGNLRTRDDAALVETHPAAGTNELIVTVLNNPSFPLLRYCIEDTTTRQRVQPDRGFGILRDVQGRRNDLLVSQSGRRLHSMAIKHVLEHWPQVRRFSAQQAASGDLHVLMEANENLDNKLKGQLCRRLERMLEGFSVEIEVVERIPGNLAGKHRWIVSERIPTRAADADATKFQEQI